MIEVELEKLEDFYRDRINNQFFKIKKATKKLISNIRTSLIEIKDVMDQFIEVGGEKVDEKALRSLNFFSDKIKKEINDVDIPDEIYHEDVNKLLSSIKKLFNSMNEIQRKALPKFARETQAEIKILSFKQRNLAKKQAILEQFLRKKYTNPKNNVKEAEELLKKIPKLFSIRENIENAKNDLTSYEADQKRIKAALEEMMQVLLKLEKNELIKELEQEKDKVFQLKLQINNQLGFKKALKKFKFELEKESLHVINVDLNYLRSFLKSPVNILKNESKGLPKFSSLLIQLRRTLEENKLNLKSDTKEKTIDQINEIFDKKYLQENIEKLKQYSQDVREVNKKIKEEGLAKRFTDIKNQISSNTNKLEHLENDLNRKNKDFLRHLGTLKREREDIQNKMGDVLGEEVKIVITFSF